jgi:hypothetical protein
VAVALGGLIAFVTAAATVGLQIVAEERARGDAQAEERELRATDRRVSAYPELLQAFERGGLLALRRQVVEAVGEENLTEEQLEFTVGDRPELDEFYESDVIPAITRVQVVGSPEVADLAGDVGSAFTSLFSADFNDEKLDNFLDRLAELEVAMRSELGSL